MANSVDPDQMLCSPVSDLGLHRLQRPSCPDASVNTIQLGLSKQYRSRSNAAESVFDQVCTLLPLIQQFLRHTKGPIKG